MSGELLNQVEGIIVNEANMLYEQTKTEFPPSYLQILQLMAFICLICWVNMVHLVAMTFCFQKVDGEMAAMLCSAIFTLPSGWTTSCQ